MYNGRARNYAASLSDGSTTARAAARVLTSTRSLETEALDVHFQPKVSVVSGRVIAAEALVRWTHPERGPISPEVFVGLAEQAGLIEELTRQVLASSLAATAEWHRRGWGISVAVNVSAVQIGHSDLAAVVRSALSQSGLPPERRRANR